MVEVLCELHSYQKDRQEHSLGQVAERTFSHGPHAFFRNHLADGTVFAYCPCVFSILLATLTPLSPPAYRATPR